MEAALQFVAGKHHSEIARGMKISHMTVATHLSRVRAKLGVKGNAVKLAEAIRNHASNRRKSA